MSWIAACVAQKLGTVSALHSKDTHLRRMPLPPNCMAALRRSAAEQQLAAVPARDDGALPSELETLQVAFQKPRIEDS